MSIKLEFNWDLTDIFLMHAKMCINTNLSPAIIKEKKTHLCWSESPGLCRCAAMTHLRYIINSAGSGATININKKEGIPK